MERIECPACGTSYTSTRLGLDAYFAKKQPFMVTVCCILCKQQFELQVQPVVTTVATPDWRYLWLRKKETTTDGIATRSFVRTE